MSILNLDAIVNGARSTRYAKLRKLRELGVVEGRGRDISINYFSPNTWRYIYKGFDTEYVVLRALSVSSGVLTGMRIAGLLCPNPYSDAPIYEVYVPRERADVFASVIGLRDDIAVVSRSETLFELSPSRVKILVYELMDPVDYEIVTTSHGFEVREASIEQALIDVIRNEYWYRRGIAFEVFYYAKKYVSPRKLLEIAKRLGVEKRLYTVDYVVAETLNEKPLFTASKDLELEKINLIKIIERLEDVTD